MEIIHAVQLLCCTFVEPLAHIMLLAFFEVNNRNHLHTFQKLIIKGQYIFYLLYVYRMAVDLCVFLGFSPV